MSCLASRERRRPEVTQGICPFSADVKADVNNEVEELTAYSPHGDNEKAITGATSPTYDNNESFSSPL
jgi:hypothetical protein